MNPLSCLVRKLFAKNSTSQNRYHFYFGPTWRGQGMTLRDQFRYRWTHNVLKIRLVFVPQLYLNWAKRQHVFNSCYTHKSSHCQNEPMTARCTICYNPGLTLIQMLIHATFTITLESGRKHAWSSSCKVILPQPIGPSN